MTAEQAKKQSQENCFRNLINKKIDEVSKCGLHQIYFGEALSKFPSANEFYSQFTGNELRLLKASLEKDGFELIEEAANDSIILGYYVRW